MQTLIDRDEALWAACARLNENPKIVQGLMASNFDEAEPILLVYGPVARRNQYQALLYSCSYEHNFHILPIQKLELFGRIPWRGKVLCHFHWIHEPTEKATDETSADATVRQWESLIQSIKANGHFIVWTVHNVMPHETYWPDHDRKIHQLVADSADIIHIMTDLSALLCAPHYRLPEDKLMLVPHPSYLNAQADWVTREQARDSMQIPQDEFVFLSFGAVLPYKGYDRLTKAFERLAERTERRVRLVVAGQPSSPETVAMLRVWAFGRSDVTLDIRTIPSEGLQEYFRAADVAVCPYDQTLNSGAALMAISFDLPVIGPRAGGFIDTVGDKCGILFEQGDDEALLCAMESSLVRPLKGLRQVSQARKERLRPALVSNNFFSGLRARLQAGNKV